MKKTLAVILSVIMIACCLPFSVNADTISLEANTTLSASNALVSGNAYVLSSGTLTINEGVTVYVPQNSSLTIQSGATLKCEGSLVIQANASVIIAEGATLDCWGSVDVEGSLSVKGTVVGSDKIRTYGTGSALVDVKFPTAEELNRGGLTGKIRYYYAISENTGDTGMGEISTGKDYDNWIEVTTANRTHTFDLNHYLFVKVEIIEETEDNTDPDYGYDKYDDSKMFVMVNGVKFSNGTDPLTGLGGTDVTKVCLNTALNITFTPWNEDAMLNTFRIHLPTGEGYSVYGRDGQQSADGETVLLKYGQKFSFRVDLEPEYDMSVFEVYIYDGYGWLSLKPDANLSSLDPAAPDKYGYYTIDKVKSDTQIKVEGVVANETILMIGNILDLVKNIFDMITGFFQEIFAFLGFGGNAA